MTGTDDMLGFLKKWEFTLLRMRPDSAPTETQKHEIFYEAVKEADMLKDVIQRYRHRLTGHPKKS